jgi:hypothetical protein
MGRPSFHFPRKTQRQGGEEYYALRRPERSEKEKQRNRETEIIIISTEIISPEKKFFAR